MSNVESNVEEKVKDIIVEDLGVVGVLVAV